MTVRLLTLAILHIVVCCIGANCIAADHQRMAFGIGKSVAIGKDPLEVVIREFIGPEMIELDLIRGDSPVISFARSTGVGSRSICEVVFVDEDRWFGWCAIEDFPFNNLSELLASRAKLAESNKTELIYAVSASTDDCIPELVGVFDEQKGYVGHTAAGEVAILHALREMTYWEDSQVDDLLEALSVVGSNICPILNRALIKHFEIDVSQVLVDNDLEYAQEIPDNVSVALDHVRKPGLGEWINEVVRNIP